MRNTLLDRQHRTLAGEMATRYAREELGLPVANVMAPHRLEEWKRNCEALKRAAEKNNGKVAAGEDCLETIFPKNKKFKRGTEVDRTGTIGVVCLDAEGHLPAVTSTGGAGFEIPGRVSDSATCFSNFANSECAVACTGIGEHIIEDGAAVKTHTRVVDGMPLQKAVRELLHWRNQ
ncbi:unnamed protein product [Amoebophrya sp. A25]|nr:unnamed protein product [Amoebophrya sp. A25]|eukprot:GSA25T00009155001.1